MRDGVSTGMSQAEAKIMALAVRAVGYRVVYLPQDSPYSSASLPPSSL